MKFRHSRFPCRAVRGERGGERWWNTARRWPRNRKAKFVRQDHLTNTTPPSCSNASPPIGAIVALLDRHVAELTALTASPAERAVLAKIATQAIQRGLGVGVQS